MKKLFALLCAAALAVSLAACGGSGKDDTAQSANETSAAVTTQTAETTEAVTEAPAETEAPTEEDPRMVVIKKEELVGDWTVTGMEEFEHLTINEDGTGTYKGINEKDLSFTYELSPELKHFNNGEEYINNMLKVKYDNGESEDIIIFFTDQGKLAFHNSDNGGYSGVMNYIDAWTKI